MSLFGPKRRSRSRNSGLGKGVETVMTIAAIGVLGVGAYFVLKSGKGAEEFLQTGGDFLKDVVDAGNSTGEAIGNASCHVQKLFKPGLNCGAGYGGGSKNRGIDNVDADDEEKGITSGLKKLGGDYFDRYSKGIKREIDENEDRSLIKRKDIIDGILGLGCGVIRKC